MHAGLRRGSVNVLQSCDAGHGADFVWGDAGQGGIVFDPSPKLLAAETFQVCVDEQGTSPSESAGMGLSAARDGRACSK